VPKNAISISAILSEAPRESCTEITDWRVVEGSRGYIHNHAASGGFLKGLSPKPHFASPMLGQVETFVTPTDKSSDDANQKPNPIWNDVRK